MRTAVALTLWSFAGAVAAQEPQAPQWSLVEGDGVTIAHTVIQSRIALIARCAGSQFSVMLQGAPQPADGMVVETIIDGAVDKSGRWWLSDGTPMLLSRQPAALARGLVIGRSVSLSSGGNGGRWTVQGPLPADARPLQDVMEACNVASEDARDQARARGPVSGLGNSPVGLNWVDHPSPEWPSWAYSKGLTHGVVAVSCVTGTEGTLRECRADAEIPLGAGFGREAVRAAHASRMEPDTPVGALITFDVMFMMR